MYASKLALLSLLLQEFDGVYWPVAFVSRTLKPNDINYVMVEKEVLAANKIWDVCHIMLDCLEI